MTIFNWTIESENYLANSDKQADKMTARYFINYIAHSLNDYKDKYSWEQLRNKSLPHCHSCTDLHRKKSKEAKALNTHLKKINQNLGETKQIALEIDQIFQFPIKGFPNKPEYRCFGYILDNVFYLVYLDPDHLVYKEC